MAAVSEWMVRDYLEALGFFVLQPRKYQVTARAKRPEEEMDLLAYNPMAQGPLRAGGLLWGGRELRAVSRAVIGVRGWHTERFSPTVLTESPEILRFTEDEAVRQAEALLGPGPGPVVKILCVPSLPASKELQDQALALLKARGVDGVILFRTMLLELAAMIDESKNYDKSDLMQILRILKTYGLLKDAQLDLFHDQRPRDASVRRRKKPAKRPGGDAEADAEGAPADEGTKE